MLQPKKTKWRKSQKVLPRRKYAKRGDQIAFGSFAIKAITSGRINSRQIESARIAITRYLKREGQVWIRIFPDRPVTKKPAEVRMGKGKGSLEYWATPIEPGRILFEVDGVPLDVAKEGLRLAAQKLPVVVKFVMRRDYQA